MVLPGRLIVKLNSSSLLSAFITALREAEHTSYNDEGEVSALAAADAAGCEDGADGYEVGERKANGKNTHEQVED